MFCNLLHADLFKDLSTGLFSDLGAEVQAARQANQGSRVDTDTPSPTQTDTNPPATVQAVRPGRSATGSKRAKVQSSSRSSTAGANQQAAIQQATNPFGMADGYMGFLDVADNGPTSATVGAMVGSLLTAVT
eukprot:jgi/Chrzof1/13747/Cz08g10170.t1